MCTHFPPRMLSSANHTWKASVFCFNRSFICLVAIAYNAMARGSPWVAPSWDRINFPFPRCSLDGFLYVLFKNLKRVGHLHFAYSNDVFLFKRLKAFSASTSSTVSHSSFLKRRLMACIAAYIPASTTEQVCKTPPAIWISFLKTVATLLHKNFLRTSPMPIGLVSVSSLIKGINLLSSSKFI